MAEILIAISYGELFDRMTILELKLENAASPDVASKLNIQLMTMRRQGAEAERDARIGILVSRLRQVNRALWQIENTLRCFEKEGVFNSQFIEAARSVYLTNDERAELKRKIDHWLGAEQSEFKMYPLYKT